MIDDIVVDPLQKAQAHLTHPDLSGATSQTEMSQEDAHQLLQTLKNHSNRTERDSMRQWNNMELHKITRTDISSGLGFK